MKRNHSSVSTFIAAVMSSACLSHSSMQTASTLGKGNLAGGAEFNIDALIFTGNSAATGVSIGNLYYPKFNGHFRYGITDNFDIGIRAGSTLLELQAKFMFTSPDSDLLVLSLAPALSGYFFGLGNTSIGVLTIPIPLLIGFKFGDHELVVGPRLVNQFAFVGISGAGSGVGYGLTAGGSVGIALRLGDGFILMPEVSAAVPLFITAAASSGGQTASASVFGLNQFVFSFGIASTFGKLKPRGGTRHAPPPPSDDMSPPPPPPAEVPPPPPPPSSN